jgi:hypothetical protein
MRGPYSRQDLSEKNYSAPVTAWKILVFLAAVAVVCWYARVRYDQIDDTYARYRAIKGLVQICLLWLVGWYAALFADGESGRVFMVSNRGTYVFLGVGMIAASFLFGYMTLI